MYVFLTPTVDNMKRRRGPEADLFILMGDSENYYGLDKVRINLVYDHPIAPLVVVHFSSSNIASELAAFHFVLAPA